MSLARAYTCCLPVNVLPVQLVFVEYSVPPSVLTHCLSLPWDSTYRRSRGKLKQGDGHRHLVAVGLL